MKRGSNSQLVPVILIVLIVVISVAAIVALVNTFILGDKPDGSKASENAQEQSIKALTSIDTSRGVRMTVRGELKADEKFRSYQITVTPYSREMVTYAGYLDEQINEQKLDNNSKAYEQFVYALDRAGMMVGEELVGEKNDTRGLCFTGKILEFEILQNGRPLKKLWTSTCNKNDGSLKANSSRLGDMFLSQIPKGPELLREINKKP